VGHWSSSSGAGLEVSLILLKPSLLETPEEFDCLVASVVFLWMALAVSRSPPKHSLVDCGTCRSMAEKRDLFATHQGTDLHHPYIF